MILLDSNIFVIDRFFRNDTLYPANRIFLDRLAEFEAGLSIFTLLETAGVASFSLSPKECERWLYRFPSIYPVVILSAFGMDSESAEQWLNGFFERIAAKVTVRMNLGDVLLLSEAERYEAEAVITWNVKDFARRSPLPVLTPTAFLTSR
jgi:hypothetical protein